MNLPPSSHFIYIPAVITLGVVIGFILGSRATRDAIKVEQQRADERARRKAERAAAASSAPEAPVSEAAENPPSTRRTP